MNKIDTGIAELLAKQPSDSAEKDAYIAELQKTVRLLTDEVRNMDELLALLRKKQFAPSSEQTKPTEEQLGLFNEAEQENKPEPKEPIKKDARGYHTDGYAGYNKIPHVTRCGCWAHLRRKFVEAMPPESNASIPAQIGRNLCDQLFAAEKEIQRLPPEQRQEKRLAVEQPMLRAFWCWLDELSTQPLAGSLKKAVEYAQGQRSYMENYLKDPRYEMRAFLQGPKPELLHHQKFFENGTAERAKESGTEQNYNMIDGCVNNVPKKPRRIGGRWSVLDRLHIKQAERRQKDNTPQQEQERSRKS